MEEGRIGERDGTNFAVVGVPVLKRYEFENGADPLIMATRKGDGMAPKGTMIVDNTSNAGKDHV